MLRSSTCTYCGKGTAHKRPSGWQLMTPGRLARKPGRVPKLSTTKPGYQSPYFVSSQREHMMVLWGQEELCLGVVAQYGRHLFQKRPNNLGCTPTQATGSSVPYFIHCLLAYSQAICTKEGRSQEPWSMPPPWSSLSNCVQALFAALWNSRATVQLGRTCLRGHLLHTTTTHELSTHLRLLVHQAAMLGLSLHPLMHWLHTDEGGLMGKGH